MKAVLAYLLVLPLGCVFYTIGSIIGTITVGVFTGLLAPLFRGRFRVVLRGLVSGIAGVAASTAFAAAVFRLLVGPQSFTHFPFLAATVPLIFPILGDWAKGTELAKLEAGVVSEHSAIGLRSLAAGGLVGIGLAVAWLVNR